MLRAIAIAIFAGFGLAPAAAADSVRLADLAFLEGCWEGEGLGGAVGECWLKAKGSDRLTGFFFLESERTNFSEILAIDVFDDGPALRLKHFHNDMTGWEEREKFVTFPLLETGKDFARFRGLDYRLDAEGRLIIDIVLRSGDRARTERFVFRRVAPSRE